MKEKVLPKLDVSSIFCLETMWWEQPTKSDFFLDFSYSLTLSHSRQRCITMTIEMKETGRTSQHPASFPSSVQKRGIQLQIHIGKKATCCKWLTKYIQRSINSHPVVSRRNFNLTDITLLLVCNIIIQCDQ